MRRVMILCAPQYQYEAECRAHSAAAGEAPLVHSDNAAWTDQADWLVVYLDHGDWTTAEPFADIVAEAHKRNQPVYYRTLRAPACQWKDANHPDLLALLTSDDRMADKPSGLEGRWNQHVKTTPIDPFDLPDDDTDDLITFLGGESLHLGGRDGR